MIKRADLARAGLPLKEVLDEIRLRPRTGRPSRAVVSGATDSVLHPGVSLRSRRD